MPSIFLYILKLSVALAAVYLFYQLVLRRLTFYNWNRWYLLGYTILAFLIPFINITPILENNEWSDIRVISWVPALIENTSLQNINHERAGFDLSAWNIVMIVFISGTLFLFTRLIIQFISFYRMKKKATPFAENGLTIYQVNENIIPFSFGNSIFINKQLHSEEELRDIIKHEFIHVKQKHSMDLIWGELLCLLNWYNPFAWLLKRSIRQNLEFIADNKVVQNGIDKKEYQYLLLKVIGSSQYSIAMQFNFSSLKKRIAMMNKLKSTKRQLLRLLFLLPATAILLLAFRSKFNGTRNPVINYAGVVTDLETLDPIAGVKLLNTNTGLETVTDENGYFFMTLPADKPIHVEMKYSKPGYNEYTSHSFSLEKKDNKESISVMKVVAIRKGLENVLCKDCNSSISFAEGNVEVNYSEVKKYFDRLKRQMSDTIPDVKTPNSKGYYIDIKDNKGNCMVVVKDKDKKEVKRLLFTEWNEKSGYYENLYGEILSPTKVEIEKSIKASNPEIRTVTVKNNIATVTLKNGKTEVYTLSLSPEKKAFEERCGIKEEEIAVTEVRAVEVQTLTTTEEVKVIEEAKPVLTTTNNINNVQEVRIASNVKNNVNSTNPVESNITTVVEEPIVAIERKILNLGGLTILDEGQYILLDGKEVPPASYGKLAGPYRITFVNGKDAVKKYGSKGKNGAIVLDTIR